MTFQQKLDKIVKKNNSLLCVGLDPVIEKLPRHLLTSKFPFFEFNKAIIDATYDLVCCYKPNSAFYEALGEKGIGELKKTCDYLTKKYPEIPILLDFKRGDIGNTNKSYATFAFEYLKADAITVQPYQGRQALQPFLDYKDKGIFVLCKTSNAGSDEFQNLLISGKPLYTIVAHAIAKNWNQNNNCFVVAGATYPKELAEIRKIVGDMTILSPGLGAQGGQETFMKKCLNSKKSGLIINSSRETLFAGNGKDFAQKSRIKAGKLRGLFNSYRL